MSNKQTIEIYVNGELQGSTKLDIKYIELILKNFRRLETQQIKEDTKKKYEGVCIFDPKTSIEELENSIKKITSNMNKCNKIERMGIKHLAYDIRNCNKGYYVTFDYIANDFNIQEIERQERIDSNIIKFINIKKDESEG